MAKKQTRRSISVSRLTYERLKAFCEANNISMSHFVETRVGDFLEGDRPPAVVPQPPKPTTPPSRPPTPAAGGSRSETRETRPSAPQLPMTSAAARSAVEPPPPLIKRRTDTGEQPAPKPAEKRPDQIFTF